ncbi:putative disease resistance protein [Cinnamomum micranthum f. kanehirae]|uniref:Putative disease resistance protein n=1 Tax=Cinnamomum micranthum f. kanehirae TaxID=337451 RepID=A0A3S3QXS0_9MAGN|nr:putative disease resistance protein [Cinnamomum micranthum f. kanehirae]
MEIIVTIIQIIPNLITQISNQTASLRNLHENVNALRAEAERLQAKCRDLENERASGEGKKLKEEVEVWLRQAQELNGEINSVISEFNQRRTLTLLSRYKLAGRTAKKLQEVRVHREGGKFRRKELFSSSPGKEEKAPTASVAPGQEAPTIPAAPGQDSFQNTMKEVLGHLHDQCKSTICVYGMGGIGKTHLMEAIEKKLHVTKKFTVIRVTASKDFNRERFSKGNYGKFGHRLGLSR